MARQGFAKVEVDDRIIRITMLDGTVREMDRSAWAFRCTTIRQALEWELRTGGKGRLTAKAPSAFTIIREEFGIRGSDKIKKYREFCEILGEAPREDIITKFLGKSAPKA